MQILLLVGPLFKFVERKSWEFKAVKVYEV